MSHAPSSSPPTHTIHTHLTSHTHSAIPHVCYHSCHPSHSIPHLFPNLTSHTPPVHIPTHTHFLTSQPTHLTNPRHFTPSFRCPQISTSLRSPTSTRARSMRCRSWQAPRPGTPPRTTGPGHASVCPPAAHGMSRCRPWSHFGSSTTQLSPKLISWPSRCVCICVCICLSVFIHGCLYVASKEGESF